MSKNLRIPPCWVLLLVALLSGCSHAGDMRLAESALAQGRVAVILVDLPDPDVVAQDDEANEAYGDFAYYLNDFAAHAPDHMFEFVRLGADELAGVDGLPARLEPWSVVFLHATKSSFYSNGPILEPQVYACVQAEYTGEPVPESAQGACPERFQFAGF